MEKKKHFLKNIQQANKNVSEMSRAMQVITFVLTEQHMIASEWCQSCFKIASPDVDSTLKSSAPVWILKKKIILSG